MPLWNLQILIDIVVGTPLYRNSSLDSAYEPRLVSGVVLVHPFRDICNSSSLCSVFLNF